MIFRRLMMSDAPQVAPRIRALFALGKLSPRLQSDVLADGTIEARWKIPVTQSMTIGNGISINRAHLFSVFRACADGKEIPALTDDKGEKVEAKVLLKDDGSVVVDLSTQHLTFTHAILLSSDAERRVAALDTIFRQLTLSREEQDRLRLLARSPTYSDSEFISIAHALSSSQEEFLGRLQAKVNVRQVSRIDLLPDDPQHWTNLTAAHSTSETLAEFIDLELLEERKSRLAMNGAAAFRTIALTFSSPGLVPHALFASLDKETMITALEVACTFEDHFSLIGAFETCARLVSQDQRYAELGERILDRMFADMAKFKTSCGMFGAAFVITLSALAEDEKLGRQPAYWRRLAAAAQASLVVRACGLTQVDHEELFQWAIGQSGESYYLSLLSDFPTDPQWRPEWIVHRFLVGDAIGRAWGALEGIPPENQPQSWRARIETVREWAKTNELELLLSFPALMEGARRPPISITSLSEPIQEAYRRLETEPSFDNLLILTPAIHAFGFPVETRDSLQKVVGLLRRTSGAPREIVQSVLTLLAHIATLANDVKLADGVAEICIEQIASANDRQAVVEPTFRIIECAAADQDRSAAQTTLLRRLEQAAFVVPSGPLIGDLLGLLEALKAVNAPIQQRLGRALALANLGVTRFNAA
jgi:hypothetical protein